MQKKEAKMEGAEQFASDIKTKWQEGADRVVKGVADYAAYAKETTSAFAKSSSVAAKAAEKINAEALALASHSVQEGVAFAREAAAAKSVADVVELQTAYISKAYGDLIAKSGTINDLVQGAVEHAVRVASDRTLAFASLTKAQSA